MEPITTMDRAACAKIATAAEAALREVAEQLGLQVTNRGGKFDPSGTFDPKFTFSLPDAGENQFASTAHLVGLHADDFGKTFQVHGKTFRITGLNLRARKFPVCAVNTTDGKSYKFPTNTVKGALGKFTNRVGA